MINQQLMNHQRFNIRINNKLILSLFFLFLFLSSNVKAHNVIDNFPDEQSKLLYETFLKDTEEYNTVYRLNFYDYSTENSQNLPCSFDKNPTYNLVEKCVKDLLKDDGWLIIGDSHGRDLYNALKMVYPKQNIAMFQMSSCAPARYKLKNKICFEHMPNIINFINSNESVKKVIFASRFQREPGTDQFIKDVRQGLYKKNIIIFNSGPAIEPDPIDYIKKYGIKEKYFISEDATKRVETANSKLKSLENFSVKVFDKHHVFCDVNGACKLIYKSHVIYRDNDSHLLKEGLKVYGNVIKRSKILE